jgi:hypothetical protein
VLWSCEIQGNLGPFEQDYSGFWKLKETRQPDGKIIVANANKFFFREWHGSVSPTSPVPISKDSIFLYTECIPVMATAIKRKIERDEKNRKAISELDNGQYISIQSFYDQMMTDVYLEVRIANSLEDLSKSNIERYNILSTRREW